MKSALKAFCDLTNNINKQMHDTLAEFINEHGGIIKTDNPSHPTVYAHVYNEESEEVEEYRVLAVATFENGKQVGVLLNLDGCTTIKGMTDDEVLECTDWVTIYGGIVTQNSTLYNICECIEEYVK